MTAMLEELAEFERRFGEALVDDMRKTANLLLRNQFLFAGDRRASHAYEQVINVRYRGYFTALFDALGYILRVNEAEQWVGIVPDSTLDLFPHMREEHTLVLLVVALSWQEEVNRGRTESRAVVSTTLNALFERYRDLAARGRKESLTTARFEEGLRELERRSLVRIGPLDPEEDDKQVDIRPMINLLVDADALARLERFVTDAEAATADAVSETEDEAESEDSPGDSPGDNTV
ncbi:MAG TPA: DUF4194 domain-containing protein [Rhodopila sp.]|jgi:hypothetical protein|nr:DUF4194 domain-containing protein [Rhodopila sp.]